MKLKWIVFFLFPLFLNAQEVKMTEAEIKAFKEAVVSSSKSMQSLTADFVQSKHASYLTKPIETLGEMSFKTPSMVLWKYKSPNKYSVIFKENKVHINEAGKKKSIGSSKMFNKLYKLIVGSFNGELFDEKEFVISYFKVSGKPMVKLIPKDNSLKKYIKEVGLYFERDSVSEVKLMESSDDFIHIFFKNKKFDTIINNDVFSF
jgi:outer membrane lipoprotein-sorting protein